MKIIKWIIEYFKYLFSDSNEFDGHVYDWEKDMWFKKEEDKKDGVI